MGQVAITLNDRTYRLVCDDGEEDHLADLAQIVKAKIEALRADVGHVGDERLMLMAALLIADDLVASRAAPGRPKAEYETFEPLQIIEQRIAEPELAQRLRAVAAKMAPGAPGSSASGDDRTAAAQASPHGSSKPRRKDVA
jgi:cell division protein ZapA